MLPKITNHVKVKIKGKKPVYLEHAKYIHKGDFVFVSGYVVNKQCDPLIVKNGDVIHLIQLGAGVEVVPQTVNKTYCELEDEI